MTRAYAAGLRIALRRWPVALVLFAANLLPGLAFTAASWSWLDTALDNSLATRSLLTDLNMNVFVDLVAHHAESLQMLVVSGVLLGIVTVLAWVWLNAVAIVAVAEDGPLSAWTRRAWIVFPRFVQLWLLAMVVDAASVFVAFLVGRGLAHWTAESSSEMTFYWVVGASAIFGGTLVLFFGTVHDHARIHSAATERGALHAYGWALGFVGRRQWRALPLAMMVIAAGGGAWLVYQTVGMLIPATSGLGVVVSIVWGETFLLMRMLLRLWNFAAATELQSSTAAEL